MPWWVWLCLGIFLLSLVATAVFAVFAFGKMKQLGGGLDVVQARLDEVALLSEEAQRKQARNQEHLEELQRHRARTEASIAKLRVLTEAYSEATGGVRRVSRRYLKK